MPGGRESPRRRERRSRSLSSSSSNYKARSRSPRRSYSRKSRSPSSSDSTSPYRRRRSFDHSSPPQHGPPGHYGYKNPYYGRRPRRPRGFYPRGRGQMRGRGRGYYYNNYNQHPRGREPPRESPHRSRSGNSDSDRESPPLKRQRPFRPRGEEDELPENYRRQDSRHSFDRDRGRRQESFSPTRARPSFSSEGRRGASFEGEPKPGPSSFSRSSPPPRSPFRSEEGKKSEAAGVFFDSRSLSSVRPPSSIGAGLGRKLVVRRTLDERFSHPGEKAPDLEENITIAIQRNPLAKISSSSTVRKLFDPDLFAILRRKDEGKKPLFDRPEIEMFGHDVINEEDDSFERRVIQVIPPQHSPRQQAVQVIHTDYKSTASEDKPSTSWQHTSRPHRPDHYVPAHRDEFLETDRFRDRSVENPGDLRHNLSRRRFDNREDMRAGPLRYRRGEEMMEEDDRGRRQGQRDFNPALDRGRDERFDPRRMERMDDLPVVSRRPDKFRQTSDWMDNPEMVPKGSSYFEHDDRDEKRPFGMRRPFRSRPFIRGFRPRGNFRGNPRGGNPNYRGRGFVPRGNYRGGDRDRPSYQGGRDWGEWKHDMFDKLEGEEDKEPSSTTKP